MSSHSVNIGETFTSTIEVKPNSDSIGIATFMILYEDALIEIQDVQVGSDLSGFYNADTAGVVYFTGINARGIENDFVALSITFVVLSSAPLFSNLEIVVEQLADQNGSTLTYNKTDGLLNLNKANCGDYLFVGNTNNPSTTVEEGIYQASKCIESNGIIIEDTPNEIVFKAGEKIHLLPGFEVQKNVSFSIDMEGCAVQK